MSCLSEKTETLTQEKQIYVKNNVEKGDLKKKMKSLLHIRIKNKKILFRHKSIFWR